MSSPPKGGPFSPLKKWKENPAYPTKLWELTFSRIYLNFKWAEIWSEDKFLIGRLDDFDFGHFSAFLAELW